jgi:methylglutamate dehydrogenase subunit D
VAECTITERGDVFAATIMARKGVITDDLAAAAGVPISGDGRIARGDRMSAIPVGPGVWLAVSDAGADDVSDLATRTRGLASVSDQTGSYLIFRVAGPSARLLLQRGLFVDLDEGVFGVGDALVSVIAHIDVIVWQDDGAPTFEIAVFRSYADAFRHWLHTELTSL